jgi:predicted dehydrogenase
LNLKPSRIALIGCGYVADFYLNTLANHPNLELAGVFDRDRPRLERFAAHYKTSTFSSYDEILADPSVDIVVNLTNPRVHHEVSRQALEAGKHVYSEKPLATVWDDAVSLVELAESRGLLLASAPCNVLGETAQTLWKAVREGVIGPVRLVYAEMDDGMIHRRDHRSWQSESGSPWPSKDEFEVGCTLEHAGYVVSWLTAFFGSAESVTSFAACLLPDKGMGVVLEPADAPDFSVGCIKFASGVVARLTCSILAPHDHTLRIIGDDGLLTTDEVWDYGSPVYLRKRGKMSDRAEKFHVAGPPLHLGSKRYPLVRKPDFRYGGKGANRMDFCRGVAELAGALTEGRPCRLSARFSLHVNEIVLALQDPASMGLPRILSTTFDPVEPMPWASSKPSVPAAVR